jgi:hypothetical protein
LSIANKRIHETEETRVLNDRLQTQLTLLQAQLDEAGRLNATLTDEMRAKSQSVQSSNGPSASSEVIAENADLKERVQEYYRFLSQAKQTIETLQTEKNNAISERGTNNTKPLCPIIVFLRLTPFTQIRSQAKSPI